MPVMDNREDLENTQELSAEEIRQAEEDLDKNEISIDMGNKNTIGDEEVAIASTQAAMTIQTPKYQSEKEKEEIDKAAKEVGESQVPGSSDEEGKEWSYSEKEAKDKLYYASYEEVEKYRHELLSDRIPHMKQHTDESDDDFAERQRKARQAAYTIGKVQQSRKLLNPDVLTFGEKLKFNGPLPAKKLTDDELKILTDKIYDMSNEAGLNHAGSDYEQEMKKNILNNLQTMNENGMHGALQRTLKYYAKTENNEQLRNMLVEKLKADNSIPNYSDKLLFEEQQATLSSTVNATQAQTTVSKEEEIVKPPEMSKSTDPSSEQKEADNQIDDGDAKLTPKEAELKAEKEELERQRAELKKQKEEFQKQVQEHEKKERQKDEEKRVKEGGDAALGLAGIAAAEVVKETAVEFKPIFDPNNADRYVGTAKVYYQKALNKQDIANQINNLSNSVRGSNMSGEQAAKTILQAAKAQNMQAEIVDIQGKQQLAIGMDKEKMVLLLKDINHMTSSEITKRLDNDRDKMMDAAKNSFKQIAKLETQQDRESQRFEHNQRHNHGMSMG